MIPNNEYDSVSAALMMKQELCNYTTSSGGCSSYGSPTSLTSYEAQPSNDLMMQRSVSSQSFYNNNMSGIQYHQQLAQFCGFEDSSPVRKAFSTGDLEVIIFLHSAQDSRILIYDFHEQVTIRNITSRQLIIRSNSITCHWPITIIVFFLSAT